MGRAGPKVKLSDFSFGPTIGRHTCLCLVSSGRPPAGQDHRRRHGKETTEGRGGTARKKLVCCSPPAHKFFPTATGGSVATRKEVRKYWNKFPQCLKHFVLFFCLEHFDLYDGDLAARARRSPLEAGVRQHQREEVRRRWRAACVLPQRRLSESGLPILVCRHIPPPNHYDIIAFHDWIHQFTRQVPEAKAIAYKKWKEIKGLVASLSPKFVEGK